jgi:hypothetical protein
MKKLFVILVFILSGGSIQNIHGQSGSVEFHGLPLNPDRSVLFGKDIIIGDQPTRNQRNLAVCTAFNGWMYVVMSRNGGGYGGYTIYKSIDNGMNWSLFKDAQDPSVDHNYHDFDILACGNSISDLKVFISWIDNDTSNLAFSRIAVIRINGSTGVAESILLSENENGSKYYNVKLCSDYLSPSIESNPYSVGILFSERIIQGWIRDSVIFCASTNGGISITKRKSVAASNLRVYGKVSIAYGRSPSMNSGEYFATWEDKDNLNHSTGHIYTAHSDPGITGSFTTPVCLDCGDAAIENKCSNPTIACSYNSIDNDSANITSAILYQRISAESSHDISGVYNLKAATGSNFHKMDLSVTSHNEIQPSITFNHFDNNFFMTYYDSTEQKLPCLSNNFNFSNPDSWTIVSAGYNDSTNLKVPFPMIIINENQQKSAYVWNAEGNNTNGIAMFDAEYSTYTGASENKINSERISSFVFPNPASSTSTLFFELNKANVASISISTIYGQKTSIIENHFFSEGKHEIRLDVNMFVSGLYIYSISTGTNDTNGKFIVAH